MKIQIKFPAKLRLFAFLVVVGLVAVVAFRLGERRALRSLPKGDLTLFWWVWRRLEERYLDKEALKPEAMIEGAIKGMVAALGDPYTVYLPPSDNKITRENLQGEFGGIGIQLGFKDHTLAVIAPLADTPAERAGLQAGDLILRIRDDKKGVDKTTEGMSLPEAVALIRGEEGTPVVLTIGRQGRKPFEVEIVRGRITIPALEASWKEQGGKRVAVVQLLTFSEAMKRQWRRWLGKIKSAIGQPDFGGLVLDLRNNPGGFLQGAVFVASEFLPKGTVVVWQEDYRGIKKKYSVERKGKLLSVPLVVLVNKGSASAAEILAGALQEHKRAKLVGERTFGKGTVQEAEEVPGGGGLHITVARWLLPSGASIDKKGIKPDFEIKEATSEGDPVLKKALEILSEYSG